MSGQQLHVAIASPDVTGSAGEVLSLVASVENRSSEPVEAKVGVTLPRGWSLLLSPGSIHLQPGETRGIVLPLVVPQNPSAGDYPISLELITGDLVIPNSFIVRIPSRREVRMQVDSAPTSTLPRTYETIFVVSNRGNRAEQILLSAKSNMNLVLRPDPEELELAPGESSSVRVVVPAINGLARPSRHIVTLTASAADNGATVTAIAHTEVIAVTQPERLAFHTFPVELRLDLAASAGSNVEHSAISLGRIEVGGRGTLSEESDTLVGFKVRFGPNSAIRLFSADIHDPEYRMLLGEQRQSLGKLLPDARGLGLTIQSNETDLPVSVYGLSTSAGPRAGISIGGLELWDGEYTFRGTFGPNIAVASAKGLYTEQISDSGQVILEVEPSLDFMSGEPAIQSSLQLTEAKYEFTTAILHRNAGYLHGSNRRTEFRVSATFDLLSDLELVGNFETDSRGSYSSRRASIGIVGSGGELRWNVLYKLDSRRWSNSGSDNGTLSAAATFRPNDGWGLGTVFSWSRLRTFPSNADWETLNIRSVGFRPMSTGDFLFGLGLGYDITTQQLSYAAVNTGWRGSLAAATSAELQLNLNLSRAATAQLRTGLTHELAYETRIKTQVDLHIDSFGGADLDASINVVVPLDVRLSRKEGVSAITGRIRDASGEGIPDLVVSLAGFTVLTQADGSFTFPAIPEGDHVLFVPGLAPSQVAVPRLPLTISAPNGQPVELSILDAATVRGEVKIFAPETGTTVQGATEDVTGGRSVSPGGLRVKLISETEQRTALTTSTGRFEFSRLPPGDWTASIDENSVPGGYSVEPTAVEIRTEAGELAEVGFAVRPVRRKIRFMNGGTLGCGEGQTQADDCGSQPHSTPKSP